MASIPVCMAPDPNTRVPKYRPPPGACDAHCHIFGPGDQYPYAPDRSYTPPDAPLERFVELQKTLGLSRAVLVNASCHGVDNTVILDAIAQSGGRYRGVANVDASFTDRDFTKLHDGGIRGIRFNFVQHLGGTPDMGEFKRARRARGGLRLARRAALRCGRPARVRLDAAHVARAVHHRSHGPRADEGRPRSGAVQAVAERRAHGQLLGQDLRRRAYLVEGAAVHGCRAVRAGDPRRSRRIARSGARIGRTRTSRSTCRTTAISST